jgi:Domain of unknown function (DUF4136)
MRFIHYARASMMAAVLVFGLFPARGYAGKARTHLAPGVDISQYKTYQWLPTRVLRNTGLIENDPTLTPLIKEAVNRELAQLGLTEVSGTADLQIAAGITTHALAQVEAVLFAGPYDLDFATPIATMGRYNHKGSLIVNLIDTRTKKSAWAGVAEEDIDKTPGAGQKKIANAARNLFKKFPGKK